MMLTELFPRCCQSIFCCRTICCRLAVAIVVTLSFASQSELVWSQNSAGFSHTQAASRDSKNVSAPEVIDGIIATGRDLEMNGRWGEALSIYQKALKHHPESNSLKQRRAISRIHYELERRYSDNSFVTTIRSATPNNALNLYAEVLLKIESYHVNQPDWENFTRHGLASLEIAITDSEFRKKNLPNANDTQIGEMVSWLRKTPSSKQIRNRQDAYAIASSTARTAQSKLGLPVGITCYEFISGTIVALDPYSSFLSQSQYGETMSQIEGNFVGLGVELKTTNDQLEIVSVIPNGPAGAAGIMGGDKILSVDGQLVNQIGSEKAADMLRGVEGSFVAVSIETPDGQLNQLKLRRQTVAIPSVESVRIVDPESGVGYIRITNFQKTTTADFDKALWDLQRKGMQSLIVDVRSNPGGLLNASVEIADRFVNSGVIVSTQGRNPLEDFVHRAKGPGTWRVPLVVLIDGNSASASEIFAAAIADHDRGVVVGEQSYGKGSVQGIFPLNISGGGIRLTTAKFYSPKGQTISQRGVKPHVQVEILAKPSEEGYMAENTDAILRSGIEVARRQLSGQSLTAGR